MTLLSGDVLLTGATGGIGQAVAEALSRRGARLTLTGRNQEILAPLAERLDARMIVCDLSSQEGVEQLLAEAGNVDVLIANAALPGSGRLDEFTLEQVDRSLDVNLRAPIVLAHALAPGMVSRGRGHFVFVSSLAGRAASPASSIYSATKFGLRGFAFALRADLREHGVGVSVVSPGFIREAGMFAESGTKLPRGVGTRSPQDVADGVIRAIEQNRAEVDVAPLSLRLGATIAAAAPGLAAEVSRRLGNDKIATELAAGQVDKRG